MHQLAAIMFTDIKGYTALMQKDEENAIKIRKRHREILESITGNYNGTILQYYGDGTLSIFKSALDAVQCGIDLQLNFRKNIIIPVRIGIHLGEIEYDKEDVIGDDVDIASQIESMGLAGSVLISEKINNEISNLGSIQTDSLGKYKFKKGAVLLELFSVNHTGLEVPTKDRIVSKKGNSRFYNRRVGKNVLIGALVIILAFFIYKLATRFSGSMSKTEPEKSVAVLPFTNMSDDPFQEYFSDGITEEIINNLGEFNELKVISRTSIMNYKNTGKSIKEIGEELDVSYIVEGSVRKYDNQILVSAKLINVETDNYLWTKSYDGQLSKIFSLQVDLALNIVKSLDVTSTDLELEEIEKEPTQNFTAYNSYLKGIYQFETYSSEGYKKAVHLFQQTIDSDPNFDAAYGRLALAYIYLASWAGDMPPHEAKQKAIPYAHKALELNENLYLAHNALALINFWFDWDFEEAEVNFKRGLEVSSAGANTIFYQQFLINMGRFNEALALGEKALETDPLHHGIYLETGLSHFFLKQYDQAEEILIEGLRLNSSMLDLYNKLGKVYLNTDRYDDAIIQLEKGLSLTNARPPSMLVYLAIAHIYKGQTKEAHELLNELLMRHSNGEKGIAYFLAHLYNALGDNESTLNWLETAYSDHEVDLIWLKVEPQFEDIHKEPRFQAIIQSMGFPE